MCCAGGTSSPRPGSSSPPRAFVIAAPAAPHAPSVLVMPGPHLSPRFLCASHHPFDRLSSPLRLESSPPRTAVITSARSCHRAYRGTHPRARRSHHPDYASSRTSRVVSAPPPAVVIAFSRLLTTSPPLRHARAASCRPPCTTPLASTGRGAPPNRTPCSPFRLLRRARARLGTSAGDLRHRARRLKK